MKIILFLALTTTLLFSSLDAKALLVRTDVTKLNEQQYQANYQFYNDGQSSIDGLIVYFEYGLFDNLALLSSPIDWDMFVAPAQDIFGFQEDGFVDGLALASPLLAGETLSGMSVMFDWLGALDARGTIQRFETYDANTFAVTSAGQFQLNKVQAVNAPSGVALYLISVCIFGLAFVTSRRSRQASKNSGNQHALMIGKGEAP
tara:strand:+ start:472 stop:1080 length:609 start_codon:yes stop_codon:yes gene_type:complete